MTDSLPPRPDFETMEAAAPASAERRTSILALIGNLVFSWSNNESLFIYVLMLLLRTDQTAAALVFATLNTTRARLDLVQRLAKATITDRALLRALNRLIDRFNECTRVRNEFNHCMYTLNERGEITHTQSMRIQETRTGMKLGLTRPDGRGAAQGNGRHGDRADQAQSRYLGFPAAASGASARPGGGPSPARGWRIEPPDEPVISGGVRSGRGQPRLAALSAATAWAAAFCA